MKNTLQKSILLCAAIISFVTPVLFAQVPQAINFQAIARDGSGNPMVNTNIQIRLSIIDSALSSSIVYQELRALQTNAYGSFSFQIGVNPAFTTIGSFSVINWSTGNKHLKIDYDPTNTFTFNLTLGVIKFVTVPYAFAAESVVYINATGAQDGDILVYNQATGKFIPEQPSTTVQWNNIQNKPNFATVATSGSYTDLINQPELNISNWDTAYGWGSHIGLYRPNTWVPAWTEVTGKPNFAIVATTGSYNDLVNKPMNIYPKIAPKGQKVSVSFAGGDAVTFSQASNTCPLIWARANLFMQGTPTTITPFDVFYIDNKRFDVIFDLPSYLPSGLYDIILGPGTPCEQRINAAFKIN